MQTEPLSACHDPVNVHCSCFVILQGTAGSKSGDGSFESRPAIALMRSGLQAIGYMSSPLRLLRSLSFSVFHGARHSLCWQHGAVLEGDLQQGRVAHRCTKAGGAGVLEVEGKGGGGVAGHDVRQVVIAFVREQLAIGACNPKLRGGAHTQQAVQGAGA